MLGKGKREKENIFWPRFPFSLQPLDFHECSHPLARAFNRQESLFLEACINYSQAMFNIFPDPCLGQGDNLCLCSLSRGLLPFSSKYHEAVPLFCSDRISCHRTAELGSMVRSWMEKETFQCFNKKKREKYKSLPPIACNQLYSCSSGQHNSRRANLVSSKSPEIAAGSGVCLDII